MPSRSPCLAASTTSGPGRCARHWHSRHQADSRPSLIWPDVRSWFIGAPIYTNEIAVAGPTGVIDAVLADPLLLARTATRDEELDIDD
jgi:hypothetical protein